MYNMKSISSVYTYLYLLLITIYYYFLHKRLILSHLLWRQLLRKDTQRLWRN